MKLPVPIPQRMQHLPLDERGYPVPYFVPIVDGKPEFRYQDPEGRALCILYKKCSVCGFHLLAKKFWFISGPLGYQNRVSSDYAMHEECARFSLAVCPHLIFHKAERRSDPVGDGIIPNPNLVRQKPDELYLIRADKVWTILEQGHTYIKFRPVYAERYHYKDNKLTLWTP